MSPREPKPKRKKYKKLGQLTRADMGTRVQVPGYPPGRLTAVHHVGATEQMSAWTRVTYRRTDPPVVHEGTKGLDPDTRVEILPDSEVSS